MEITIDKGIDDFEIGFIQQIEDAIDNALVSLGFTRTGGGKSGNETNIVYYRFGVPLEKGEIDIYDKST